MAGFRCPQKGLASRTIRISPPHLILDPLHAGDAAALFKVRGNPQVHDISGIGPPMATRQ
jgi:hypothetical protein